MIPSWLLPDTITVQRATGTGSTFADPTYAGAQITMRARVERRRTRVWTGFSVEYIDETIIATEEDMGEHDRIWTSDRDSDDVAAARTPVSVQRVTAPLALTETVLR